MTEQKQPMPGEWWVSNCDDEIAYICGFDPDGDPVYMTDGVNKPNVETMSGFLENWHHEPSCTGFDWVAPAQIDPGDGWELLVKPCMLLYGDQALRDDGSWSNTHYYGTMYSGDDENIYRRRKSTAEVWPKYYLRTSGADSWVYRADGRYSIRNLTCDCVADPAEWYWRHGNIIEITESEALARVKPAEVWPKYAIGAANKLYRADSWEKVFWIDCGGNEFLQADPLYYKNKWHEFKQITETEANAMWKPAESIPQAVERTATPLVTAVVESPDDWVEITDTHPGHIHRECDEVCHKDDNPPNWIPVRSSVGMPQSEWLFTRIRCRRRDLPAPQLTPFQQKMKAIGEREREMKAQQPKGTPVRIYWYDGNIVGRYDHSPPTDPSFQEIKFDGSGFYVESNQ